MLNKDICKKCYTENLYIFKQRMILRLNKEGMDWCDYDEKCWKDGYIWCIGLYSATGECLRDIDDHKTKCFYAAEHLIMDQHATK